MACLMEILPLAFSRCRLLPTMFANGARAALAARLADAAGGKTALQAIEKKMHQKPVRRGQQWLGLAFAAFGLCLRAVKSRNR